MPETERGFRVKRSQSGRWTMERLAEPAHGGEACRELSGTYSSRAEAEQALLRHMREESGRYRRKRRRRDKWERT
jgi:hypothetical protein